MFKDLLIVQSYSEERYYITRNLDSEGV